MRSIARAAVLIGGIIAFLLSLSPSAWAVPSYTRRYGVECSNCHSVWGALTQAGNTFKLSGYRAINGLDLKPESEDIELSHGLLTIPTTLPLSFITGVGFDSRTEKRNDGAGNSNTARGSSLAVEDASIFLTSPLGKHLSAFVEFPMFETRAWEFTPTGLSSVTKENFPARQIKFSTETPSFEVAKFFWNNVAGDSMPRDSVNLLFGITHLPLAYSPGKVRLPVNQDLIYERRALDLISRVPTDTLVGDAADSLFRLSEPQGIVELYGMIVPGSEVTDLKKRETWWIEYHAGISNGSNAKADNNNDKDVYGRITLRGRNQAFGFFALHSPDTYDDNIRSNAATSVSFPVASGTLNGIMSGAQVKNARTTYGPNFTLSLAPWGIPVSFDNDIHFNKESSPTGFGKEFKWKGGLHQVNWQSSKETMSYVRYDWIRGDRFDDTTSTFNGTSGVTNVEPREHDWVLGVQHLLDQNIKLIGEYRNHRFEDKVSGGTLTDNGFTMRIMIGF